MPTLRERRQRIIADAVRYVNLKEAWSRATRQEWALSRKRAGWSEGLVDAAVSGGALARVRGLADDPKARMTLREKIAVRAVAVIDSGRRIEVVLPKPPEQRAPSAAR